MTIHPAPQHDPRRQLAPFVLLALLLHAAVLLGVRLSPAPALRPPAPLSIQLIPLELEPETIPPLPAARSTSRPAPSAPPIFQPEPTTDNPPEAAPSARPETHLWAAHDLIRDEALKIEHAETTREKQRLSTPLGQLQQALRQPHAETRLANGLLKITTESGISLCYQPAPGFARDQAGLFGIPSTCP